MKVTEARNPDGISRPSDTTVVAGLAVLLTGGAGLALLEGSSVVASGYAACIRLCTGVGIFLKGLADPNAEAAPVDAAFTFATRAEKLDHIFVAKHNIEPLVRQLGSREAVVSQMLAGLKGLVPASGNFEIPVSIAGQSVVVRGAVVNGIIKLGTAFTP